MSRLAVLVALLSLAACHHRIKPRLSVNPLTASPKTIDSLWNAALDEYAHNKWDKAAVTFDRVELEMPPGDRRALQGRLYLGELYVRSGSNLQGVREFRRLVDEFPTDSLAPEALLRAADAYRKLWRDPELDNTYGVTAQSVYTELMTRYPASPAAAQAKLRIAELDNWFAIKTYRTAAYYIKYKAYEPAVLYLKDLIATYPHATVVPDALLALVTAYNKLGYVEDIRDVCGSPLVHDWSTTPQYSKACAGVKPAAPEKPAGP